MARTLQPSFASGEITPLLHARVDLSRYSTGLSELKNMIVLPQGGVTRRAGFSQIDLTAGNKDVKLVPFVYNTNDSVMLEFGNYQVRVWSKSSASNRYYELKSTFSSPYSSDDVKSLRYVQSGNVIFFAHKSYAPRILRRKSLTNWEFENLEFEGGPWINGEELGGKIISISNGVMKVTKNLFDESMVGSLVRIDFTVPGETQTFKTVLNNNFPFLNTTVDGWTESREFEVKGNLNVTTTGNWVGRVRIERSVNGGGTWTIIKEYRRTDIKSQGQIDYTIAEQDEDVLFRVRGTHETEDTDSESQDIYTISESTLYNSKDDTNTPLESRVTVQQNNSKTKPIEINITVSGFIKTQIYKITNFESSSRVIVSHVSRENEKIIENPEGILNWSLGAWGGYQGYPGAIAMYQDRLVFASSKLEPQTIWFSRTGDYKNFSVSDPIADDDAITITLSSRTADGIHSLLSSNDLLAFTEADEWKISGSGDGGIISPLSISARCYTTIGSKSIQPLLANSHVIFIQAQGKKVYALSYDLNTDGYSGSEISILSAHLFDWKTEKNSSPTDKSIIDFAYQRIPDSLLWFALADGTAATCTYNPEHETIGWARHESNYGRFKSFAVLPGTDNTVLFGVINREDSNYLMCQRNRIKEESFRDNSHTFESALTTLRLNLNGESGNMFTAKKLISRLFISAIRSVEAWIAPAFAEAQANNWERRKRIKWNYSEYLTDAELQVDSGFSSDASIQIRISEDEPLTIAAISPLVTAGG